MIIKAKVTAEEKAKIQARAEDAGQSLAGYLRTRALEDTDTSSLVESTLSCAEALANASQTLSELTTRAGFANFVYASEIKAMLLATARIESSMNELLRTTTRTLNER